MNSKGWDEQAVACELLFVDLWFISVRFSRGDLVGMVMRCEVPGAGFARAIFRGRGGKIGGMKLRV